MNTKRILLIIGMSLVTYIPRALPAVLLKYIKIGKKTEKYLTTIPYAALGALIFPGILSVDPVNPFIGILGGGVALLLSIRKCKMAYIILSSVLVVIVVNLF